MLDLMGLRGVGRLPLPVPKSCASASSATVASGSNNNRDVVVVAGFPTGKKVLARFDAKLVSGRSYGIFQYVWRFHVGFSSVNADPE
jgi:hypothetical protein